MQNKDREILNKMFSDKNYDLSQQVTKLLENETAMDVFSVLAFICTYSIIRADERGMGKQAELRDMFFGLIDIFLKASKDAERDKATTSQFYQ